jgi:N-acetylglutamate synthase-like GNAT family acetyltransferase
MTPYTIRPATAADAETIKRMVRSERLDPNAIDWRYFLVLEVVENGAPTIASIGMVRPEGDVHEIDSVTTRPSYRKHGYAAAVVRALLERAPHPLYLLAETDLVPFYENLGFRVLTPEQSPAVMREQADFVNQHYAKRTKYHVMGTVD